jgi:hypothetical protein
MDIVILTAVILAGIALESLISERARRRKERQETKTDRLARGAGGDLD